MKQFEDIHLKKHEIINKFRIQTTIELNTYAICVVTNYDKNYNPELAIYHTSSYFMTEALGRMKHR